ncbi:MAG: glycosidase, partial [Bryobacteraceae bacterium]
MSIHLKRTGRILNPDQSRVLLRPFNPGGAERADGIVSRIMSLPEGETGALLAGILAEFSSRHQNLRQVFLERFEQVRDPLSAVEGLSEDRRLLIGSYFLAEYSLESAALFNPSIVPHPDQSGLMSGALRFILSLRATGEGHISSITFRTGVIHPDNRIEVFAPAGFLTEPRQIPNPRYEKALFGRKLAELGLTGDFTRRVMRRLGESFDLDELRSSLRTEQFSQPDGMTQEDQDDSQGIWMLARSNYEVQFCPEEDISARIIFPATPSQRNGIEDARFVR